MIEKNNLSSLEFDNNEEINLISIFKKIKRNTLLIISLTTVSTVYSIYYAYKQTPIYSGQFQILVRNENKSSPRGISIAGISRVLGNTRSASSTKKTQELILKSPFVLNPVYEFAKSEYLRRNENISNLKSHEPVFR